MNNANKNGIKCHLCVHFVTTWNPQFPRACRVYGFKGKHWPSDMVLSSTGLPCQGFARKAKKSKRTPSARRR